MNDEVALRIMEKLEDIQKEQSKVREDHSHTRETVGIMANQLTDLHKTIEGNGKPGLLQDFQKHCDQDKDFRHKFILALVFITAGGGASGIAFFDTLKTIFITMKGAGL